MNDLLRAGAARMRRNMSRSPLSNSSKGPPERMAEHEMLDEWIEQEGPMTEVVVSSRARLARNLKGVPFSPRANKSQRQFVAQRVRQAFEQHDELAGYHQLDLASLPADERVRLRESHLISREMEKGGVGRVVLLGPRMDTSVMVNEEDHLRMSVLVSGFRVEEAHRRILAMEEKLEQSLPFAYSEKFGYLTACPTNTGTGLRLSVMLHLPALVMTEQIERTMSPLGSFGLVVRGAYGEHSEHTGDLFQISNEVTLGKTEQQIMEILNEVVRQVIDRELAARQALREQARIKLEDIVCRAVGLLSSARMIDSNEATALLSRARLGVGQSWCSIPLDHARLSRLFIEVQPAHLQFREETQSPEERDLVRAEMLRAMFGEN